MIVEYKLMASGSWSDMKRKGTSSKRVSLPSRLRNSRVAESGYPPVWKCKLVLNHSQAEYATVKNFRGKIKRKMTYQNVEYALEPRIVPLLERRQ